MNMADYTLDSEFNDAFKQQVLGMSTPAQNQLEEFSKLLRNGSKLVEINIATLYGVPGGGHEGTSSENISRAEREAIGNLAKLNEVDLSVHAPWGVNLTGINPQNGELDPSYKDMAKREIAASLKFADDVAKSAGKENMPVIFHASYERGFGSPEPKNMIVAFNTEEGKVVPIRQEVINNMDERQFMNTYGELIRKAYKNTKTDPEQIISDIKSGLKSEVSEGTKRVILSPEANMKLFNAVQISKLSQERASLETNRYNLELQRMDYLRREAEAKRRQDASELKSSVEQLEAINEMEASINLRQKMLESQIEGLKNKQTLVRYDEKAPELAAKGIAEAALYSAFETNTKPMILIENTMDPSMSLSKPEDVVKSVQKAREDFIRVATKEGYMTNDGKKVLMSDEEAARLSNDLIGINLDVAHLNVFKGFINPATGKNYTDKDIVKMAEATKDYLRRYHLSDNMGNTDAHIPLGQGTTPIKQILDTLKSQGVEVPAIMETFGGLGGMDLGIVQSYQYLGQPWSENAPYQSMASFAAHPYSSLVGNYSAYSNLGLKYDPFSYASAGFTGLMPGAGGGYIGQKGGDSEGFSGLPMG